MSWFPAPI